MLTWKYFVHQSGTAYKNLFFLQTTYQFFGKSWYMAKYLLYHLWIPTEQTRINKAKPDVFIQMVTSSNLIHIHSESQLSQSV